MNDPFADSSGYPSDPFGLSTPKPSPGLSRFGEQFRGILNSAQPHVTNAAQQAANWAANNPDKLESIGERVGQAAAIGTGGGFIARKAGKKAGGKLGRMASKKAKDFQGNTGQPAPPSIPYDPSDPFADPWAR